MLIFAPSTKEQRNHISIGHTIRDRINAAYCGDIAFLFHSAMQVRRLKQNSRPTYTGQNRSAQQAADNDEYRTAVSRACASQSIATIGPTNITHVKKLYTPTVPTLGYPHPSTFQNHQTTPFLVTYAPPSDMLVTTKVPASMQIPLTSSLPSSNAPSRR